MLNCMDKLAVPSVTNTCAVVVTYFPDDNIVSRLDKIRAQIPSIIIVDNASNEYCRSQLRDFSSSCKATLVENYTNEGVGKALNQAAALAIEAGYKWILTFDQDTIVFDNLFATLVSVYRSGKGDFSIIGSNYWSCIKKRPFKKCNQDPHRLFINRRTIITSGTLLNLSLYKNIGDFREDYFIDSIDHEYCLRIRSLGLPIVMGCNIVMQHSIGYENSKNKPLIAFQHAAFRKYYMTRNTLVTMKQYWFHEPAWCFLQFARLCTELISIVFLESDKKNKLRAFFWGISDATRNKMGPIDESTNRIRQ